MGAISRAVTPATAKVSSMTRQNRLVAIVHDPFQFPGDLITAGRTAHRSLLLMVYVQNLSRVLERCPVLGWMPRLAWHAPKAALKLSSFGKA